MRKPFLCKRTTRVQTRLRMFKSLISTFVIHQLVGAHWLSGRVLDSRKYPRQKGGGFEPHRLHSVVSLSKNINPSLVLVQPRNTGSFITERLLMGRKESNQTNKSSAGIKRSSSCHL